MINRFFLSCIILICTTVSLASYKEDSWLKDKVKIDPEIFKHEISYRQKVFRKVRNLQFIKKINYDNIWYRKTQFMDVSFSENPQSFFFFRIDQKVIVGKKYISDLVLYKGLPGLFCSIIKSNMLLGLFDRDRITEDNIRIYYKPFTDAEKVKVFEFLKSNRNVDIWYPYTQLLGEFKSEKSVPEKGWVIDEERAKFLGITEDEIRSYTIEFLRSFAISSGLKGKKIYDPACSTGEFLSTIKSFYPEVYTIGQDLSQAMIRMAKPKLDEVHLGNSIRPAVQRNSIDFIFFRFLNGEVVTTIDARKLFIKISNTLKKKGYMVIFGHTPVLIDLPWLEALGFKVLQSNAPTRDHQGVFQYYVIQKI